MPLIQLPSSPHTNGKMTTATTISSNGSNSTSKQTSPRAPLVHWAQRADSVLLTIDIEDCKQPTIDLEKDKLLFRGKSDSIQTGVDHSEHEVTIEFYKPIKVDDSKHSVKGRGVEFVIIKEEPDWWPRLTKDSAKKHWLKVDFLKWKDEDDSEDEAPAGGFGMPGGQPDFGDLMQQFKGIGDKGGLQGDSDDEEFESDEDDETEQTPPDLES